MTAVSRCVLMVVILSAMAGCAGISVSTDYDTSRDFSTLKTYAWLEPKAKLVIDPLVDNDLMDKRIRRSVDAELQKRGYIKATGDKAADFLITYHVMAEDKLSVSSFQGAFGYYPCWNPGCAGYGYGIDPDISVQQYKQGTFMLDVIDPASKRLIWRGVAGEPLTSGTPQQRDAYVRAIVGAILAKFPPMRESASGK